MNNGDRDDVLNAPHTKRSRLAPGSLAGGDEDGLELGAWVQQDETVAMGENERRS